MLGRLTILLLCAAATVQAYCPEIFQNQTACSCYDYLDGSVIRCSGSSGPVLVEELKKTHQEIRELVLENAKIVEIGPNAFKNLRIKRLVLDKNHITTLHKDAFKGLENVLMDLSIAENRLAEVPKEALANLRALNVLNLKCNSIGNLTEPLFPNPTSIIDIDMSCNQICSVASNVFSGVSATLQNLRLDNNCMTSFPGEAVQNMGNLIAVHLTYNKVNELGEAQLVNLTSLSMLNLNGNNISHIHANSAVNTPNIKYLQLGENRLSQLDTGVMSQFRNLQVLDLSFNFFEEITSDSFLGLDNLQHINLDSNNIRSVAPKSFDGMPLLLLWLPNNCLTSISQAMFTGTPYLKQLSLANNNINEIQPNSFAHLVSLHHIDMANNKIQTLAEGAVAGSDHLTIRLQENPMVCNQDGFHVINGGTPINITHEPNEICRTNWRVQTEDICPKAQTRPVSSVCCSRKPVTTTVAPTTTTTSEETTTTEEVVEETTQKKKSSEEKEKSQEKKKSSEETVKSVEKKTSAEIKSVEKASKEKKTAEETETEDEDDDSEEEEEESVAATTEETSTEVETTTTEEPTTTPKRKVNMSRFHRLQQAALAKKPAHKTHAKPKYLAVTEAPVEEDDSEEEEESVSNSNEDDEEEYEEEEEEVTTTTKASRKIPARVRDRSRMLTNLPPWLARGKAAHKQQQTTQEEFNKDDSVETMQVDQPAH